MRPADRQEQDETMRYATFAAAALCAGAAQAHYGMIIPSDPMVAQEDPRTLSLQISFSHPFELAGMTLARPAAFGVVANGEPQDLLGALRPAEVMGHAGFTLDYEPRAPGVHVFHMEPQPYWEPAEDAFIVHYTKTYVAAFGDDEGWDAELGLKTEIAPLSKPFALWAGNVFQGVVKLDGEPAPHAEVEVEFYNADLSAVAPSELMVTQTVKADENGVFTYAAPKAGWWGFAALNTADYTIEHEGEAKPVELGAVLWVRFEDWETR
jgi:cobalt/nickel transport protein